MNHDFLEFLEALIGLSIFICIPCYIIHRRRKLKRKEYENTDYYKSTHTDYNDITKHKLSMGSAGEFGIFSELSCFSNLGARFLFNVYVPTEKGYTEVDCIMLYKSGIFVFESKNYSGWIFGKDSNRNWTQSLYSPYNGVEKYYFYNPVLQNEHHIQAIKDYLKGEYKFYSIIVFSNFCEFKTMIIEKPDVYVIHSNEMIDSIINITNNTEITLDDDVINNLYNRLYPYTQLTDVEKELHVNRVKNNK